MSRHRLAVVAADDPLLPARLFGVLRTRRLPFAVGFDPAAPGEHRATVLLTCDLATAERVALHLRRIVGVQAVTLTSDPSDPASPEEPSA